MTRPILNHGAGLVFRKGKPRRRQHQLSAFIFSVQLCGGRRAI